MMCKGMKEKSVGSYFIDLIWDMNAIPFLDPRNKYLPGKTLISKSTIAKIKWNQNDFCLDFVSEAIPFYRQHSLDLEFLSASCICFK